jgi:flagellar assembly protein FliH
MRATDNLVDIQPAVRREAGGAESPAAPVGASQPHPVAHRYRFPPLRLPPVAPMGAEATQAAIGELQHQGYQEGFQSGQERGYQEGLREGIERGAAEGLATGLAEGRAQGEAEGRAVFEAALAPLGTLVESLERTQRQRLVDQTDTVCELVTQIARRVIHSELTLNPQQILTLVQEAMQRMDPEPEKVSVYLNSEDIARLAKVGVTHVGEHRLRPDPELSSGDCRIESSNAELAFSVDQHLEQYVESFRLELYKMDGAP